MLRFFRVIHQRWIDFLWKLPWSQWVLVAKLPKEVMDHIVQNKTSH